MTYHFVITIAVPGGMANYDATYDPKPGETRQDAYRSIRAFAQQKAGFDGPVVFFSLEPNSLEVTR